MDNLYVGISPDEKVPQPAITYHPYTITTTGTSVGDAINPNYYKSVVKIPTALYEIDEEGYLHMEAIDLYDYVLTEEEELGMLKAFCSKYILRLGNKDNWRQDLKKAKWYLNRLEDTMEAQEESCQTEN